MPAGGCSTPRPDMTRTLLFGGTFDPVHIGHLVGARIACEILSLDRVLFIPAHASPHKPGEGVAADAAHRLTMLRLAVQDETALGVCDLELRRPPPSYTWDTLQALREKFPGDQFTLLLGADQLPLLHTWHHGEELFAGVAVAVLPRTGSDASIPSPPLAAALWEKIRGGLLATPRLEISSTMIRNRLRAGLSIRHLTPSAVEAYILRHGLYEILPENQARD